MVGAGMIGIYAVASSAHAMVQHSKLSITKDKAFNFMGREMTSLCEIYANGKNGRKVSEALRNYIAASVDNTKDNTLSATNQNKFTVNVSTLLARLGYTNVEIAVLMNQPIIKDMVATWQMSSGADSIKKSINTVVSKYKKAASFNENDTYNKNINPKFFEMEYLKRAITKHQEISISPLANDFNTKMLGDDAATKNYFKHQAYVGMLFQRMAEVADDLSELSRLTRQDTQASAAGKWISDNLLQEHRVNNFRASHANGNGCLEGWEDVLPHNSYIIPDKVRENPEEILDRIMNSSCPYLQAFYNCGILGVQPLLKQYFPMHYNNSVYNALFDRDNPGSLINLTATSRLSDKTMGDYFEQLSLYKVMGLPIFQADTAAERRQKRKDFIYNFKKEYEDILRNNPEIQNLQFIQNLEFVRINPKGEYWRYSPQVLQLKGTHTSLKTSLKNLWTDQWMELASISPDGAKLAQMIYAHVLFTSGFKYGPKLLATLCPVAIRQSITGYSEMYEKEDSLSALLDFNKQFALNNLDNRDIAPVVSSNSDVVQKLKFLEPDTIKKWDDGTIVGDLGMFEVVLTPNSSPADKTFAKKESKTNGHTKFKFKQFITIKAGKKGKDIHHFSLVKEGNNRAIYAPIEPLGVKGRCYEYEYGGKANMFGMDISDSNVSSDIMTSAYDQGVVNNDTHEYIEISNKQEEQEEQDENNSTDPEYAET